MSHMRFKPSAKNPKKRVSRVASLIKKEIGALLGTQDWGRALVTVEEVEVSPDLYHAHVWYSVYPEEHIQWIGEQLLKRIGEFQHIINKRLRMRPVPQLHLVPLKKGEQITKLDEAFRKIEIEKEKEKEQKRIKRL